MRTSTTEANGLRFTFLEDGEGPLVLLLHGFPDDARTWSHQIEGLAAAGFHAVAPYTRGYPPTEVPAGGFFDVATLATDAAALIRGYGGGPAVVVGHDWGAATTYVLAAAHPELVRRAVVMSVPHPAIIAKLLTSAEFAKNAFHFWYFQIEGLAETALRHDDFAFVDFLWSSWSPSLKDPEHLAEVKETLGRPGAVEAALGYYRAMLNPARQDPARADVRAAAFRPIEIPVLGLFGSGEVTEEVARSAGPFFNAGYRVEMMEGGHFLQRERPEDVTLLLVEWASAVEGATVS